MDKHIHTVVLQPGTDEAAFLSTGPGAGMEVVSNLNMFDSLISMRLSDSEVQSLLTSDLVIDVEREFDVVETAYPTTPEYTRQTTLETRNTPSGTNGADYSGTNFWFHGGVELTANSGPVGFFTGDGEDAEVSATIEQNFAGEYVDIVAVEAGTPNSIYDSYAYTHPDFQDANNNTRFVKTNWTTYDSGLVDNDQASANTEFFSAHAIGVLSAAAGKYCGWSKVSSMRVVYLSDGVAAAYNGVLNFHQNKPVNPATGVRNATVVTGAWGFSGVDLTEAIPIDSINRLDVYDEDGNLTTINRGDAIPAEWTITLNAADSSAYQVTGADRVYYGATASTPVNNRVLTFHPGDVVNIVNNAHASHPVEIQDTNGNPIAGVTGAGTANLQFTMPDATVIYRYQCTIHSGMRANMSCVKDTSSWQDDFRPFVDNLMVPRVINDPADSTDKWMIPWNIGFRYTTLDTIMANYNNAGGIYHFQSAGNNSTVGVSEDDPRKDNTIYLDNSANYVDINLDVDGRYQFVSRTTASVGTLTEKPCRVYAGGGANQITVAACQHSTINPLLDDYSSRGPMVDVSATGAYTWTAYPVITKADGTWGYFSGTSCAGPVAAGTASIMICDFFIKRGVYPTIAQLKEIITKNSKRTLVSEELISSWMHPDSPTNFPSNKLYSSSNVFRISENDFQNGGSDLSDLFQTSTDVINIPWSIRLSTGKYINSVSGPSYGRRPALGQTYPRRKIRVEA